MYRFTKSGLILAVLLVLLYISSLQSQSGLLFLVIGVVVGCYVLNVICSRRSVYSLSFKDIPSIRTSEQQHTVVSLEICNNSSFPAGMSEVASDYGVMFRVGTIPAESSVHISPQVCFDDRGVYPFSELKLTSTFPFGLFKAQRLIKQPGEFVVYPSLYSCESPKAAGFEPMIGGGHKGIHRSATGSDFAGVRPYQPRDPVKAIHWKSSSKGMGLMVKEFNEELSGKISFIIDCSPGKAEDGEDLLNRAARAAGSMVFASLAKDHHVEIISLDSVSLLHNPSFFDGEFVLEALARMVEKKSCLTFEKLKKSCDKASAKSAICLILTRVNEDVTQFINYLLKEGRTVSVCLPEGIEADISCGVDIYYYKKASLRKL